MSRLPTMAGTSAIRHPRQSSCVTARFENELERARTRHGIADVPAIVGSLDIVMGEIDR